MSVTQQKSDLREIIHSKIEKRLTEHPEEAQTVALAAVSRLCDRMTLEELRNWHTALFVMIPEEDD
jgi:hypothetical protein